MTPEKILNEIVTELDLTGFSLSNQENLLRIIRAACADARREALEDAACEMMKFFARLWPHGPNAADAIRALASAPEKEGKHNPEECET